MSTYLKRNTWFALGVMCAFFVAQATVAASFDCAKAGTKVEKFICGDAELSKLDEELNAAYKAALQDEKQAEYIKQVQKLWMKERNGCADAGCVRTAYRDRISKLTGTSNAAGASAQARAAPRMSQQKTASPDFVNKETYALAMSKNDEMCNHMLQLMNDDLNQFGRVYDSHDGFVSGLDVFKSIPWKPARASSEHDGRVDYMVVEGALFDLNNDGVLDFVVRDKSMLSGMDADGLYMFDRSVASRSNSLTFKELFGSNNQIALAGWFYDLSAPLKGQVSSLWRLSPFIYHGISYVYMQSLYKKNEAVGRDFVVIAKYIGGKFHMREMTGKMEDICYIERVDVK